MDYMNETTTKGFTTPTAPTFQNTKTLAYLFGATVTFGTGSTGKFLGVTTDSFGDNDLCAAAVILIEDRAGTGMQIATQPLSYVRFTNQY